jgi:transcriptional regulator with XRE-family HTH domain
MGNKMELGKRIRQIRVIKGLSQTNFAELLGRNFSTSTISCYEKGTVMPQEETLLEIAKIGGVTKYDLINGGEQFEKLIGSEAANIEGRRTRFRGESPRRPKMSQDSISKLIEDISSFRDSLDQNIERLVEQEQNTSELEKRLLRYFRRLPESEQEAFIDDMLEWAFTKRAIRINEEKNKNN